MFCVAFNENLHLMDTARVLCGRVYETVRCPSVCLFVPACSTAPNATAANFAAVGATCGRYRSTAAGAQQQTRAVSRWQLRCEAETQTCVKSTCIILSWASAHRGKWGQLTPWKNGWKIRKRKHAKKSSFLCLRYILRAIRAGRCR